MGRTTYSYKNKQKLISVTDGIKVKPLHISTVLLIAPNANDSDIRHDVENL